MTTLDFEVEIGPLGVEGSYPVHARALGGNAEGALRWPWASADFDRQLAAIQHCVLASSADVRRATTEDEQPVRELGQRLFETLIAGDVRDLYVLSKRHALVRRDVLRLVLRVRSPELSRLPWEFLFDPGQQDYLGLIAPLVRYPQVPAPHQPLRVPAPLRILGMVARPGDLAALDMGKEQQRLQAALADLQRDGLVELEWVAGQTYRDLEDTLDKGPWHVFHFIGHGGYDRVADESTLGLAGDIGGTESIGAEHISQLLAEHFPRLVVLNACCTGRSSATDAFSSTAAALIRREVPAVVAMQFEISDSAAIRFAQSFYEHVAKHRPVDDSVRRARRQLQRAKKDSLEWGTPVLYLRTPDGRIFDDTIPISQSGTLEPVLTPRAVAALPTPTCEELPNPPPARLVPFPKAVRTLRHRKRVNAVAFSPDGRWLATASADKTARIWDSASGMELLSVTHRGWLIGASGVAFSPDGCRLATAGGDGKARVWDAASGQELARVTHDRRVRQVVFSPDGRRLATASDDMTARISELSDDE